MSEPAWHQRTERGSLSGMRFVAWFYRTIGHRFASWIVGPVVLYFFLTDRRGRAASRAYLERVARTAEGAAKVGAEPGWRASLRHYLAFGQSVLDRVGIWLGRSEDFSVVVRGIEHLEAMVAGGRGGVILGAHVGSFDAMRLIAAEGSPRKVNVLMHTAHAAQINALFAELGESSGNRPGVGVIQSTPGKFTHLIEAKRCVDRGEVVAILADRAPPGDRGGVCEVSLLGDPAALPESPMRLAASLRCPVVLMAGLRLGPRRYEVCVEPFAEKLEIPVRGSSEELVRACRLYAEWLESLCKRAPYQWFNFFDFWSRGSSLDRD